MALSGKYISALEILERLYRDNGYQYELPWEDCVSWTFDALNAIGAPSQYVQKVTGDKANPDFDVTDYRIPIPCDVYKIQSVAVDGVNARYSGNTMHMLLDASCCTTNVPPTVTETDSTIQDFNVDPLIGGQAPGETTFGGEFSPQLGYSTMPRAASEVTFLLNDNYIILSVKEAKVCLSYLAYPVDSNGFPLIPDDISFITAVTKYLTMKLDYIEWRRDPNSTGKKALFDHSEREWMWYVGQAGSKAKIPSMSMMESLKGQMLRIMPDTNRFANFFKDLGSREYKKLH